MKYFFVFNPGSRNGKSKNSISRIQDLLNEKKVDYEYGITESLNDAYVLSKKANLSAYDVVVAVGGDGTINKVLNGFYSDNGLRLSKARLGVIYTGTSPDFCKSYRIPYGCIERSIDVLLAGKTTNIQVGMITLTERTQANKLTSVTCYFSCCANIGLGAAVARHANSGIRKTAGDSLGTLSALIRAFKSYRPIELRVTTDDKKERLSGLCNFSVGKTFHVASGIKVNNALNEGDSNFYVLTVRNVGWMKVPRCLWTIYSGRKISNSDTIRLAYSKKIEISSDGPTSEVEFDGDPQGFLPCRIEMAKEELELINEAR
ncbi:MAG: diacylglycerol kinase [Nanoarchaeota archaeon]|nr:diacylglycerol kinase [Nanoarchaeota archaeon]